MPRSRLLITQHFWVRHRLHQRLDSGRGHVVCVCGPAGAGKSSLLAAWSGRLEQHVVWYRVDADDRDIASFFDWFGRTLTSEGQLSLPVLSAEHLFNPEHFARRFFRAYFVALPESAVLVLDNIHEALEAPEFAPLLPILADEQRPGTTLVLSSRGQPTGAMLALMAKPENSHIGWADLRCTDVEAAELARSQTLPAPTVDILRRADGWMAALALLLRQAALDLPATWPSLRDAEVFETLAARAFDALAPTQQQWLLVNAHSPWIDADSTDRLCGTTGAANGLDALSRARFFIERQHSGNRVQYVCHALLRAFLQHRAQAIWPGTTIRQHARHHAAACDALGDPDAAIALYALAEAWPAAAEVILRQAPALLAAGKLATLLEWIHRLPAGCGAGPPVAGLLGRTLSSAVRAAKGGGLPTAGTCRTRCRGSLAGPRCSMSAP